MIHIFNTSDPGEIRKIKAEYFDKMNDRHMVPILENPDEGLDPDQYEESCQELIGKIIDEDNCVVICSTEFKFLLKYDIYCRTIGDADKALATHSHPFR